MPDYIDPADMSLHRSAPTVPVGCTELSRAALEAALAIPVHYRVIDGATVREMTTPEKDANLATWQAMHSLALYNAVNDYGLAHYSERSEFRLKHEYNRAIAEGKTNRAALIKTALDWSEAVIAEYMTRAAAITAASTHDVVLAVSLDFSSFDASDPTVSVVAALQVPD